MECEMARTPLPNERHDEKDPLTASQIESLAEFNALFNPTDSDGSAGDPFSTPSSPGPTFDFPFSTAANLGHLSTTLGPGLDPFNPCSELHSLQQDQAFDHPYHLDTTSRPPHDQQRHTWRRSVSEPPDGFGQHQITRSRQAHPCPPSITFTRDGHSISTTPPARVSMSPYHGKMRGQYRQQPYRGKPSPQQMQVRASGYQDRRAGSGPTSAPHVHPISSLLQLQHNIFESPPSQERTYVSSRVCTPIPGAEAVAITHTIDPTLAAMESPGGQEMASPGLQHKTENLTIAVSMDEFRTMIFEAVQKAMVDVQRKTGEVENAERQDDGDSGGEMSIENGSGKVMEEGMNIASPVSCGLDN